MKINVLVVAKGLHPPGMRECLFVTFVPKSHNFPVTCFDLAVVGAVGPPFFSGCLWLLSHKVNVCLSRSHTRTQTPMDRLRCATWCRCQTDVVWYSVRTGFLEEEEEESLAIVYCAQNTQTVHTRKGITMMHWVHLYKLNFKLKWPTRSRKQSGHGNRQLLLNMSQHFCGNKLWMPALFKYHIISQCGLTLCLTTDQQQTQNSFWSRTSISKFISSPDLTWPDPFSLVRTCTSKSNWESVVFFLFFS